MELIHQNSHWLVQIFDSKPTLALKEEELPPLKDNQILVKNHFSSINFRDLLAVNGNLGVARRFPYTPGVDFVGEVLMSTSKKFQPNEFISVLAAPYKSLYPGGWSKFIICNENDHIFKIPQGWSLQNIASIGTAGLAAASGMSFINSFFNNDHEEEKKMLITGATGGVGSVATLIAEKAGWDITALTRSVKLNREYLETLGANSIIELDDFLSSNKQNLLKSEFTAAFDNLGGEVFAVALKKLLNNGILVSAGLVKSQEVENFTVLPFLMRGVVVAGTGSEILNKTRRKAAFATLESIINSEKINTISSIINFEDLGIFVSELLAMKKHIQGRIVIKI